MTLRSSRDRKTSAYELHGCRFLRGGVETVQSVSSWWQCGWRDGSSGVAEICGRAVVQIRFLVYVVHENRELLIDIYPVSVFVEDHSRTHVLRQLARRHQQMIEISDHVVDRLALREKARLN